MNKVLKIFFCLILCHTSFSATLESQKSRRISKAYKLIFNKKNVAFKVLGSSFSNNFEYKIEKNKQKVFLIWSGEALKSPKNHREIILVNNHIEKKIKAKHFYENYSQGKLFLAISELTLTKGNYKLKASGETKKVPKFFGHGMILIDKKKNNKVKIFAGLEAFYPGSVHGIDLKENIKPKNLAVVGGHGLKGNGSTNLINGKPLSLGDDWNGSSGDRWDIDNYYVSAQKKRKSGDKQVIFEVDPLLQWVFPLIIIGSW